jgi:hypothetical protein
MLNEVEDGELSSDQELSSKKSRDELSAELVLNNEEKIVLKSIIESGTESGEISDLELENPYVEEDVRNYLNTFQPIHSKVKVRF